MLQRALPVQQPHIALGQTLGVRAPSRARTLVDALIGHCRRLLRLLGEFVAAGGPLS
jgi:hypothetical protein